MFSMRWYQRMLPWWMQEARKLTWAYQVDLCLSCSFASYKGDTTIVKLLLDQAADTRAKNDNGCDSLYYACSRGLFRIVALLIERGAQVRECINNNGETALMAASKANEFGSVVVGYLLKHGAAETIDAKSIVDAAERPFTMPALITMPLLWSSC